MKDKFAKWKNLLLYPTLIILLTGFLAFVNYESGTFLSGWDTLHPEFNLKLYLERTFFGAWQEHQGVGAAASQAHAAELPRLILISLLSAFLPLASVRYAFVFLTLFAGALGIYFFAKDLLSQKRFAKEASFLASVFYLLNLVTVQQFYVPLEMFAVHYATLPWLFYLVARYLKEGKRKILFWFLIVSLFGAAMAHTATLFFVYFGALSLFVVTVLLLSRKREVFKRGVVIILLTLIANSFWLLPNLYYIKNHADEVTNSNIHRVFSNEAFLQSKDYGNLEDLALSKNFLFNWREFDFGTGSFVDLMDEWKNHLSKPYVKQVGFALFGLALFGVLVSFFRGSLYTTSLLPLLFVSVFFLINSNPPFGSIFDYLRNNFELFKEGLRFPFTKFSILFILTLSTYFAMASQFVFDKLGRLKVGFLYIFVTVTALVYFTLPAFQGYLISPSMRVSIPDEYTKVFDYFEEEEKEARVAKLPLHTFWGWNFYSWGYQGAGFTWFGIPQATLDREFDRWSKYNESFYNQASFALYSKDKEAFERTLEKYEVDYLVLDESVINAGGSRELLFIDELKQIANTSEDIKLEQTFGFLSVYKTNFASVEKFISVPETYVLVDADTTYTKKDPSYEEFKTYVFDKEGVTYPFANFDTRRKPMVIEAGGEIRIISDPLTFKGTKRFSIPETTEVSSQGIPGTKVSINQEKKVEFRYTPEQRIVEDFGEGRGFDQAYNCDIGKLGEVEKSNINGEIVYKADNGGVSCDFFDYEDLSYSKGYILHIKGENKKGRSLKIYLQNHGTRRMDLEELLPQGSFDEYYFILPANLQGTGYSLNLETRSYGDIDSENIVEEIEFFSVPIDYLKKIKLLPEIHSVIENNLKIESVDKVGTTHYLVETSGSGLLVLGQGYEDGWEAHVITNSGNVGIKRFAPWLFGERLQHVRVNNWANGWYLPPGENIVILTYGPQYLQYLGLGILIIGMLYFLPRYDRKRKQPTY